MLKVGLHVVARKLYQAFNITQETFFFLFITPLTIKTRGFPHKVEAIVYVLYTCSSWLCSNLF